MTARLPSRAQVIGLLDAEFCRAGYEVEEVVVDTEAPVPRITVIADGDTPLDMDTVAALSRTASSLLDGLDFGGSYVLEVSSPGVERPLTTAKHFRRARGRKVALTLSDGSDLTGRVSSVDDDRLTLVVRAGRDWELRTLPIDGIVKGIVQVEFSPPAERELQLARAGADRKGAGG